MLAPRVLLSLALVVAAAAPARAQTKEPIRPVAFDVRVVFAGVGQDPVTAQDLAIETEAMPGRGLGLVGGLHVYPIRRGGFAIGIGGELLIARGAKDAPDDEDETTPPGPAVRRRLQALSGQVSLNFGHRNGWSYLTGGMGPMLFQTYIGDEAPADPNRKMTINMGGGARWNMTRHVALNLDLRFYLSRPDIRFGDNPARERRRMMMMSAGLSFN